MESPRPHDLFDRETEWRTLESLWRKPRPDLVFVMGRRRAGKSFMLTRFAQQVGGIYYQATRRTEAEQLAGLTRVIGQHFDDAALQAGIAFPSWEDLFGYITRRADGSPFLFVLDEFPYLAAAAPALTSIIQSLWDHAWPKTQIKLVLSGSYISAMNQLEEVDQPLYGRRTAKLVVGPFGLAEAALFMPGWSVRDQMIAYGMYGHLPGHLSLIDAARPLGANVADALLTPSGRLVDEAQHMLDAFTADAHVHYSIIEAIAGGEQTWGGITKRVGRVGGTLQRAIRWLEEMQVIARVAPVTERNPQRSKRAVYRIIDPYVAFWHRLIAPLVNAGTLGLVAPEQLWNEAVSPALDDYMGLVFEEMCRDFVRRGDRLPFRPVRLGEWWDGASRNQVDVVAIGGKGDLLVGECKWGRVTAAHLRSLRERAHAVAAEFGGVTHIHTALFSGRGEGDDEVLLEAEAGATLFFSGEDLRSPVRQTFS
ncbi:ATP-binding protein [Longimicrobium sp.]|uniref:ATP-binding protein n=1 Tax=Longimicrobium sp. TaxID=2029185 RepID=UPI002B5EB0E0|nr:ATP-binding protein [Longimicrobium sp.]HSU16985.1 ATP-binding protein [Longimicrobium sp.]